MRTDDVLLADILDCARILRSYVKDLTQSHFLADSKARDAILVRVVIIGESSARISDDLKNRYKSVPWGKAAGLRNLAVHDYFGVHWPIVWSAATKHVPLLERQCRRILRREFPGVARRLAQTSHRKTKGVG